MTGGCVSIASANLLAARPDKFIKISSRGFIDYYIRFVTYIPQFIEIY
jgi:hypothetical protein